MSATPSTMLELGIEAPDFALHDPLNDTEVALKDFKGAKAVLVIFMCNHCPYVKHLRQGIIDLAYDYEEELQVIAVSSNDVENYPDDSPAKMAEDAERYDYPFPYLYDETQEVAKAYHAACTPDFFLFNEDLKLVYRGQFDDSRPGNDQPVNGYDIRQAIDLLLQEGEIVEEQRPSIGCNIKWKPGNEPEYYG